MLVAPVSLQDGERRAVAPRWAGVWAAEKVSRRDARRHGVAELLERRVVLTATGVEMIGDAALVLEYPSVYDVHTPLNPNQPIRSQGGSFSTATILQDAQVYVDPTRYDSVLLFSIPEVPGWINSGHRGKLVPAKNIGMNNQAYGWDPAFPAWPNLLSAPHLNSVDFLSRETDGYPNYGSTLTAFHEIGHEWGVYWAPDSPGPRDWNPTMPIAWLASASAHWSWPQSGGVSGSGGVWTDPDQPGILYSGPTGQFNAFDLYAMGLMGYAEASQHRYGLEDLAANNYTLGLDDLIHSLALRDPIYYQGDGRRVPDTDPTITDLRTLIIVAKGANDVLTDEHRRLLTKLAHDIPGDWSTATWGRSSMTAGLGLASPRVVAATPSGASAIGSIDHFDLTFDPPLDRATFGLADDVLSFTGPTGASLMSQVTAATWLNDATLRVAFNAQTAVGTYALTVGPDVRSWIGRSLDQDGDGTAGESVQDRVVVGAAVGANVVGPDLFGYRARAVPMDAIDLIAGGPGVSVAVDNEDDASFAIPLGDNAFNFYGATFTGTGTLFASSNGMITFGSFFRGFQNDDLTGVPLQGAIAVCWDDWRTDAGTDSAVLYRFDDLDADGRADRLVIEWNKVPNLGGILNNPGTFQAVLELNTGSRPGEIRLYYPDLSVGITASDNGAKATVGIKDATKGGSHLLVARDHAASAYVGTGRGILMTTDTLLPAVQSVRVNDGHVQRSRISSLTVTFDRGVTPGAGAFTLTRRDGVAADVALSNPSGDGRTWLLLFSGLPVLGSSLVDGIYDLRVLAPTIHSADDALLTLPLDFVCSFHRLYSDVDGDGDSDNADLFQMRGTYGKFSTDPAYKWFFDYDGDGDVDNADVFQVRSRRSVTFLEY